MKIRLLGAESYHAEKYAAGRSGGQENTDRRFFKFGVRAKQSVIILYPAVLCQL
jgi:hypothetical protein